MISRATMNQKPEVIELDVGPASTCLLWVRSGHLQCKHRCPLAPAKADMCGANSNVRYGPIADTANLIDHLIGASKHGRRDCEAQRLRGFKIDH